jgi:hypothetical protein
MSADQTNEQAGHSVPRLYKLTYLETALRLISEGLSFDKIRLGLIAYASSQKDLVVLPKAHDPFAFWSPAQEALAELMRIAFVESSPLPSERKYVDAHRTTSYSLTEEGAKAAAKLRSGQPEDRADFLDVLSVALVEAHPGFAALLTTVEQHALCIPEYTIERISKLADDGPGSQRMADDAISRMTQHWPEGVPQPQADDLARAITEALNRRFPRKRGVQPSQKDVLDTMDDAVLSFFARARNIRLDAISFNVCMSWASQLAILEQSRYVEGWPGRTVWATASVRQHSIERRGFRRSTDLVVQELGTAFRKIANTLPEARASGSLPIHRVRATAAFSAVVNLRLVDMILARILSGELKTSYTVQVALGSGTRLPPSEQVFTYQGRRFFEIMITERKE